ncbi:cysteine hydrolase family protein [Propioniciclava flava]
MSEPWLVVIDAQRIFADPSSAWASPQWPDAAQRIASLLPAFAGRMIVTRWIPPRPTQREGSWAAYMAAWPFADRDPDDPMFDLVEAVRPAVTAGAFVVDAPTFGKWEAIAAVTGPAPTLVVAGVATDCCVISTVLPSPPMPGLMSPSPCRARPECGTPRCSGDGHGPLPSPGARLLLGGGVDALSTTRNSLSQRRGVPAMRVYFTGGRDDETKRVTQGSSRCGSLSRCAKTVGT